ncbi:MAG: nuclear transport factor 2 family protein [Gammaproteobacteria bacterium]|nr:nuclear transport factor 2 family protein [Gammaproteobacteria bacterium]MBK6583810.1 nuclear transport factor 2 family protein [Gammaproteobacteria bacterium]MBK7169711.1 nuclear transport factor 2 family protein [Gammaproteobacteria bacterium]MBK7727380.1 nuclear transport factor 2 family protein [Gammaproteobacteria bacterium]MBK9664785.1 nuclear transport factor 2 family protein [Gammaproteobacteria bacterium]
MWFKTKLNRMSLLLIVIACGQPAMAAVSETPIPVNHQQPETDRVSVMQASDPAIAVVEKYFALMRNGDISVVDLFHPDALLLGLGRRTTGSEAIRKFYTESIASGSPQPRNAGPLLSDGSRVAAEIHIGLSDGSSLHVIDLFTVKDGRIQSLNYFLADEPPAN